MLIPRIGALERLRVRVRGVVRPAIDRWRRRWKHIEGRVVWQRQKLTHDVRRKTGTLPRPRPEDRSLIFGVGMHRTGTRSLDRYFSTLGMMSLHWPRHCEPALAKVCGDPDRALRVLDPLFDHYDCFTDVPFSGLYRELATRFPRSRFVLTYREPRGWWRSMIRHWGLASLVHITLSPSEQIQYQRYAPTEKVRVSMQDEDVMIAKYEAHFAAVQEYFAASPERLVVVRLESPDKNEILSRFLGSEVLAYPHVGAELRSSSRG
jgi:hypothetical protein